MTEIKDIASLITSISWPIIIIAILIKYSQETKQILFRLGEKSLKELGIGSLRIVYELDKAKILSNNIPINEKRIQLDRLLIAKESALLFDQWMENHGYPKQTGSEHFQKWLKTKGINFVSQDYDTLTKTTQFLSKVGYSQLPEMDKEEFKKMVNRPDPGII